MADRDLTADLKKAAEKIESLHPGAHVLCVAIVKGEVRLYAKSPLINDRLDAIAALEWTAQQTARTAALELNDNLAPLFRKEEPDASR